MGQSTVIAKYLKPPKTPAVLTKRDGREVCTETAAGEREYERRREILWVRQLGRCAGCRRPIALAEAQFGHGRSRGMGGGFRDDRIWDKDGKPMNACLCGTCNMAQGSRKYEWRDGVFQAAEAQCS